MARVEVFAKVGLVLASFSLVMSLAAAQEASHEVYDDATSRTSVEVEVIDASPDLISPKSNIVLSPEPSRGAYKKLEKCASKIAASYTEEIYDGIFIGESVTADCCKALTHLGYDCHIQMVKFLLSNPKLKEKTSEALPRSVQLWQTCASVVNVDQSIAPSLF